MQDRSLLLRPGATGRVPEPPAKAPTPAPSHRALCARGPALRAALGARAVCVCPSHQDLASWGQGSFPSFCWIPPFGSLDQAGHRVAFDTRPVFDGYLRGLWAGRDLASGIAPGAAVCCPVVLSRPLGWGAVMCLPASVPARPRSVAALLQAHSPSGHCPCGSMLPRVVMGPVAPALRVLGDDLVLGRAAGTRPHSARSQPTSAGCAILSSRAFMFWNLSFLVFKVGLVTASHDFWHGLSRTVHTRSG